VNSVNIAEQKKIVFTGPECSGKSTLAAHISEYLNWPLVTEAAREYLSGVDDYHFEDLKHIAALQLLKEEMALLKGVSGIICDTDILTIDIWAWLKFGEQNLLVSNEEYPVSLYILCKPDFPVIFDAMREDAKRRKMLFDLYLLILLRRKESFIIVEGKREERVENTLKAIHSL
jgi:nicotinamide riboside kinase